MPFELEVPTEAKLTDYQALSDKDREPDANPGAALWFTMTVANEILSMFDGSLRGAIFTKNANSSPGEQESIVSDLPNLTGIGKALGQFHWDQELTGYTLTFDYGLAGKSNFDLSDCKLMNWAIQGKEGGSTFIKVKVEAPDVAEKIHGKLAMLKSQTVKILLAPPEVADDQAPLEQEEPKPRGRSGGRQSRREALAAQLGHTE